MANNKNLVGKRFGHLVVLESAGRQRSYILWKCQCDCGERCYVNTNQLQKGRTKSCGCLRTEIMSRTGSQRESERKTTKGRPAVEHSTRQEANKNSKSGIRGVCWISSKQLWKVQIMYNKVPYHLGYFKDENKQDAIDLRKRAENLVKAGKSPGLLKIEGFYDD